MKGEMLFIGLLLTVVSFNSDNSLSWLIIVVGIIFIMLELTLLYNESKEK